MVVQTQQGKTLGDCLYDVDDSGDGSDDDDSGLSGDVSKEGAASRQADVTKRSTMNGSCFHF